METERVEGDLSGVAPGLFPVARGKCMRQERGRTQMRNRSKGWIAGGAGLCALALSGVLLAQAQNSDQQNQRGGGNREGGREAGQGGQDTQLLIAHGLAMAIEGSTLQGIAM